MADIGERACTREHTASSLSLVIILLLPARYLERARSLAALHTRGRSLDWKTTHTAVALHHRPLHLVNKTPFDREPLSDGAAAIYDSRRHELRPNDTRKCCSLTFSTAPYRSA